MGSDPRTEYRHRIATWDARIAVGERRHLLVSNLRLLMATGVAIAAWLGFGAGTISHAWVLAPSAAFLALVVVHAFVLNSRDRARRGRDYYIRGMSRLDGTWMGVGPDGTGFLSDHAFARDLDLFGPGSLFQLIDTARTEAGETMLADWLRQPAGIAEIAARQEAIAELRDRLDFRETLAIHGADAHISRTGALARWSAVSEIGFRPAHAWLFAGLAVVTAIVTVLAFMERVPFSAAVLWVAVQAGIVSIFRRKVWHVLRGVDAAEEDLNLLSRLLERIESAEFTTLRLRSLREALVVGGVLPSRRIKTLRHWIAARDAVRNEFVRPFALLLLVRSQSAVAIDRWHAAHRIDLARWLTVIGELEALASLATYAFEHPADPFPTLSPDGPVFLSTGLAHPLLPESTAVANDVQLGGEAPCLLIVSGSNMSGKSTLLRAVGVNCVLALAGAPVRARSLMVSPVALGATIHVQDSLQDGRSRFYAEILKIRDIVRRTRDELPVLFLLDEILGGTNSYDRRIGAEGVVRALIDSGAIGLMTTHDLALTELEDQLDERARNVHFEDRIEGDRVVFDYRMRDGVVTRSNALELMRSIGLDV